MRAFFQMETSFFRLSDNSVVDNSNNDDIPVINLHPAGFLYTFIERLKGITTCRRQLPEAVAAAIQKGIAQTCGR
jgi:hypothetical protein